MIRSPSEGRSDRIHRGEEGCSEVWVLRKRAQAWGGCVSPWTGGQEPWVPGLR